MAAVVGVWQMCHNAAVVVQILFATRVLRPEPWVHQWPWAGGARCKIAVAWPRRTLLHRCVLHGHASMAASCRQKGVGRAR